MRFFKSALRCVCLSISCFPIIKSEASALYLEKGPICLSCEKVTISCEEQGFYLGLDCVLHIPAYACAVAGLSSGDTLDSGEIGDVQKKLGDFSGSVTAGEAHDRCVATHELVHAKHATRSSGGSLLACDSETGAYDKEIQCLEKAKENAASDTDTKLIERQQEHAQSWRDYNMCLCSLHPNQWLDGSGGAADVDWSDVCAYCQDVADVDGDVADQYCSANDPEGPIILCGFNPDDPKVDPRILVF